MRRFSNSSTPTMTLTAGSGRTTHWREARSERPGGSGPAIVWLAVALSVLAPALADAADEAASSNALIRLSIEDLANIKVSSVSKSVEALSDAPAAIFVISHDDIIRSGATRIPEMLRLAPNLAVAQVNASTYAISARGFNGSLADKLLVLIDGRSVYSPLYAGVQWDFQQVPAEDIERIEVISGPGGTLWGANAVNGVINIITRNSSDTQGGFIDAGAGNIDLAGNVRYGGRFGDGGLWSLRLFEIIRQVRRLDALGEIAGRVDGLLDFLLEVELGCLLQILADLVEFGLADHLVDAALEFARQGARLAHPEAGDA